MTGDPYADLENDLRNPGRRKANGSAGETGKPAGTESTWRDDLAPRCAADLHGKAIPSRQWLVPDWVPLGHITSIYGRGGGGKTTLAMQLGASASIGAMWLGMQTRKCRVGGVLCEDDEDEIHRKLADAADTLGRPLSDFRDFAYLPRLGEDNLLVARSLRGGLATTDFYARLKEWIGDEKLDLVILDGIADVFGGNVNDPAEATQFLNAGIGLMKPNRGTLVLLGHPNKAGTSEFTGCGAWENKPRARLYLAPPPPPKDGEEPDLNDPRRVLMRSKANYSAKDKLDLVWKAGAFRVADPRFMSLDEKCEAEAQRAGACVAFLAGLDRLDGMGVAVSESRFSPGKYAPKVMGQHGLAPGFSERQLGEAMSQLLRDGLIKANQPKGWSANRNKLTGLARVA